MYIFMVKSVTENFIHFFFGNIDACAEFNINDSSKENEKRKKEKENRKSETPIASIFIYKKSITYS